MKGPVFRGVFTLVYFREAFKTSFEKSAAAIWITLISIIKLILHIWRQFPLFPAVVQDVIYFAKR